MAGHRITERFLYDPGGMREAPPGGYGRAAMTPTPWGDLEALRAKGLRPGPGTPREVVRKSQRRRLLAAMVVKGAEKGYANTSVADLLAASGVSRRTFYEHFEDKEACFLATLDEILGTAMEIAAARMGGGGSLDERARSAVETILELAVTQRAAACLCLVEAYAAGPPALARVDRAMKGFEQMLRAGVEEQPDRTPLPEEMVRALVGGLRKIVHTRLHRGTEAELPEVAPDLLELGLSYQGPGQLRRIRRANREAEPKRDHRDHSLLNGDPSARIAEATMSVVAEKGYSATTMADIAEAAGVSLSTLYTHFDGKAEAFDAALYGGRARLLGVTLPAYRRARSWPEGLRAVTATTLAFFEREPAFTRLITVDVYAAGPQALERRDLAIEAGQRIIEEGAARYRPGLKPIAHEAIMSALYSMVCHRVQDGRIGQLVEMTPLATYIALAPLIGSKDACTVANGGRPAAEPLERR